MRHHTFKALAALAIALVLSSAVDSRAGIVVVNPSFEAVQIGPPFLSSNPADIPGWTHTGTIGDARLWHVGYVDGGGSVTVAGEGNQFVTLGGGFTAIGTTTWSQVLSGFIPGDTYTLAFLMAAEAPFSGIQNITVDFPSGSSTPAATFSSSVPTGNYWLNWAERTYDFVATSSSVTVRFSATTQYDVGLDNVRVTPAGTPTAGVPEPGSFALLASAAIPGAAWLLLRRRGRK